MKKKIILLCTAAAMVAVLAVGGTLAYLTDRTPEATNTFAIGAVLGTYDENGKISKDREEYLGEVGTTDDEYDNIAVTWSDSEIDGTYTTGELVSPGQKVQKAPRVLLDADSNNAYVRLTVVGLGNNGYTPFWWNENIDEAGLEQGCNPKWHEYPVGSGIWYYDEELTQENQETVPLFDSVQLAGGDVANFATLGTITVYAELIQSNYIDLTDVEPLDNNPIPDDPAELEKAIKSFIAVGTDNIIPGRTTP